MRLAGSSDLSTRLDDAEKDGTVIRLATALALASALCMAPAAPALAESEMHQSPLLERTFPDAYPAGQDMPATASVRPERRRRAGASMPPRPGRSDGR